MSIFELGPKNDRKEDSEVGGSKRDFLKTLAAGVGIAAVTAGGALEVFRKDVNDSISFRDKDGNPFPVDIKALKKIEDPNVYKEGGVIDTPLGSLHISGWNMFISQVDITSFNYINDGSSFVIRTTNSDGADVFDPVTHFPSDKATSSINLQPVLGAKENSVYKMKGDFRGMYPVVVIPGSRGPKIKLEIIIHHDSSQDFSAYLEKELFDTKNKKGKRYEDQTIIYSYKVDLPVLTVGPRDNTDKIRVLSVPGVPKEQLETVHDLHRLCSRFKENLAPIYVFDLPEADGAPKKGTTEGNAAHNYNNYIRITASGFTNPSFKRESELAACHEIFHSLVQNSNLFKGEEPKLWEGLKGIHENFIKALSKGYEAATNKVFRLFTESEYIERTDSSNKNDIAGHPWTNADEFLASFVSATRYFPDRFKVRFHTLTEDEKTQARKFIAQAVLFLEAMDKSKDHDDLRKLIPEYVTIKNM